MPLSKRDQVLKELFKIYKPTILDKKTVEEIMNTYPTELDGFKYVHDPIKLVKKNYIRYIDLRFRALSECQIVEDIEYETLGSVKYVSISKTIKIKPSNYFIFQSKYNNGKDKVIDNFIKQVYAENKNKF